jgi:four helix bundle protein
LRSAVSVVANIAEGRARSSRRDYALFLSVARGSLMETDTLLAVAQRLGYIEPEDMRVAQGLIAEVSKMLTALRRRLLEPKPET